MAVQSLRGNFDLCPAGIKSPKLNFRPPEKKSGCEGGMLVNALSIVAHSPRTFSKGEAEEKLVAPRCRALVLYSSQSDSGQVTWNGEIILGVPPLAVPPDRT